ncbi:apical membrane antigen, putative [Eimeria tenella]|uniref:Apical membrane antigen, putative n=1 Tax=Eimeria tenella TaxID=5802 RepID=U6KGB8_EIMTE|nr:apical membrane antigen, putative [Eimeria tenella]CDJ36979.1 apical membrane antigen, putative [Eimeria tenella]|eukprot:XP_013227817.1 apical membrane antigen, putative [Eimeria tenella]
MEALREGFGLRRLCCISAVAAFCLFGAKPSQAAASNGSQVASNPWGDSMQKFNIPYTHGSGVYVDLGNEKTVSNKKYREPAGRCPVMGKEIRLQQPTTDSSIWPGNYLEKVPTKGSPQDTRPLGGGFAMWDTTPVKISPLTLSELEALAEQQRAKNDPTSPASEKLAKVTDGLGLCAWWAWATYVPNGTTNLNDKYRYPFVWNEETKVCTLLGVSMQLLEGAGKYCSVGDASPVLTWYCFYPEKTTRPVSYNSPYVREDHATACPEKAILGAHFGTWDGTTCQRMKAAKQITVPNPTECGKAVFKVSSSDNPTQYTKPPTTEASSSTSSSNAVATMWPVGAFSKDEPRTQGVGTNYANWYTNGTCEMYDMVPTCFTLAPNQFSFTSLGSADPSTAELPPCTEASEGWEIYGYCECGDGHSTPWKCENGQWIGGSDDCNCSSILPVALGVSFGLLVPIAALIAYFIYKRKKETSIAKNPEKKKLLDEDEERDEEFLKVQEKRKHKQSDLAQEAEPSFWGETPQDHTNVVVDHNAHDAYY